MSKVMSLLEKYNVFEKVENQVEDNNQVEEMKGEVAAAQAEMVEMEMSEKPNSNSTTVVHGSMKKEENNDKSLSPHIHTEFSKKMSVEQIYNTYGIDHSKAITVFTLQNLIQALPQSLPKEVLKESVINVMKASHMNLEELVGDGHRRLEVLEQVMRGYSQETGSKIHDYNQEIARLTQMIEELQEKIQTKERLLEEQAYAIKNEAQKIDSIIEFFEK